LVGAALLFHVNAGAQTKKPKEIKPATELALLRAEFIKAAQDYKESLAKLSAILERNLTRAEEKLAQSQKLYAEGLLAKRQIVDAETEVATAKALVKKTQNDMANADAQIADTLLE